jgi:hypothetical protein
MEEVAAVKAAMHWLFDVLDELFDGFRRWQSMLGPT